MLRPAHETLVIPAGGSVTTVHRLQPKLQGTSRLMGCPHLGPPSPPAHPVPTWDTPPPHPAPTIPKSWKAPIQTLPAQQCEDLVLSLPQLRLLLWHGFDPWPRSFCLLWARPQNKDININIFIKLIILR